MGRYNDSGGHFSNIHPISCLDGPDRFSLVADGSFPLAPQNYPSFQNTDTIKPNYGTVGYQGDSMSPYSKCSETIFMQRTPCYDFHIPGYMNPNSYTPLYKEPIGSLPANDRVQLNGQQTNLGMLSQHERSLDGTGKHHGWKPLFAKPGYSDRNDYGQIPTNAGHSYYNPEYPCGYARSPSPALQTVITTTTKVSYQAYKPPVVKYPENGCDVKALQNYSHLQEGLSEAIIHDVKAHDDFGVIKTALGYQDQVPTKSERLDNLDFYKYGYFV